MPSRKIVKIRADTALTPSRAYGKLLPACEKATCKDPWCSGQTCGPVKAEIAGSNPVGSARKRRRKASTGHHQLKPFWFKQPCGYFLFNARQDKAVARIRMRKADAATAPTGENVELADDGCGCRVGCRAGGVKEDGEVGVGCGVRLGVGGTAVAVAVAVKSAGRGWPLDTHR
jgi:hypothetical protein